MDHHLQNKHNILFSKTTEKTKNRDNKLICKLLTEIINLLVKRKNAVSAIEPPPSFLIKYKRIIIFGN